MLLNDLKLAPPSNTATARDWHIWKNQVLSTSMDIFIERHSWFTFKKQDIYENLRERCAVPAILATTRPGMDVSSVLTDLDMFVFKKSIGHSSKDVYVLRRSKETNIFECLLTKKNITLDDLQNWVDSDECVIEQSLSSFQEPIPMDFKCYLIDGVVKYFTVINRNATKPFLSYFHANPLEQIPFTEIFSDIPKIWFEGFAPYSAEVLHRIKLAQNEAERLAREVLDVRGIIVRLDMYVTPSSDGFKVWLGEITPRPGSIHSNWLKRRFIQELFELDIQSK